MKRHINRLLPVGSRRRRAVKKLYRKITTGSSIKPQRIDYSTWQKVVEPRLFSTKNGKLLRKNGPLISVVVPAFNTPDKYLKPLVDSFIEQSYPNWQLCIADASTSTDRAEAVEREASRDERIKYIRLKGNHGIAVNTNKGIKAADGEYIGFADHDDMLSPHALEEIVKVILQKPEIDLIYSDEDKLSDDGKTRSMPFFKPDWSPSLLEGVNYMAHMVVVKKDLVTRIGYLRKGFDGAQDYDFVLRATDATNNIYHIPKILYHWRMADGSTARGVGEKNYADDAGRSALKDHIKRRGLQAKVVGIDDRPTNYRLKYAVPSSTLVSIIIPFKDKVEYLEKLVPSIIEKSAGINYEIILISNNSVEDATRNYLKYLKATDKRVKTYEYNKPFNYSAINNYGRKKAKGNYLVFLNNDTEVLSNNWLGELVGVASQPGNGAVGPLLLYPNNTVQHAGVTVGMNTMAGHPFRHRKEGELTDFGLVDWPRNYLAVTGACLTVSGAKFDQVGGFDESIIIAGSDVALCLSLYEAGYLNVFWPFAKLYHYENISVGTYDNGILGDYHKSRKYYAPYLDYNDPYFNPNLDLMNESIALRSDYETSNK